jgi:hypothetical protein
MKEGIANRTDLDISLLLLHWFMQKLQAAAGDRSVHGVAAGAPFNAQDEGTVKTEGKILLEGLPIPQLKLLLQLMQMLFSEGHGDTPWQGLLTAVEKCDLLCLCHCRRLSEHFVVAV